jgi:hypothetical protein
LLTFLNNVVRSVGESSQGGVHGKLFKSVLSIFIR